MHSPSLPEQLARMCRVSRAQGATTAPQHDTGGICRGLPPARHDFARLGATPKHARCAGSRIIVGNRAQSRSAQQALPSQACRRSTPGPNPSWRPWARSREPENDRAGAAPPYPRPQSACRAWGKDHRGDAVRRPEREPACGPGRIERLCRRDDAPDPGENVADGLGELDSTRGRDDALRPKTSFNGRSPRIRC